MSSTVLRASSPARLCAARSEPRAAECLEIEAVYEAHFDFVWRSARRLGATELYLDDVVQEVFVIAQRRLHEFAGRSQLKTWLFAITRRVVQAYLRRAKRQQPMTPEQLERFADPNTPDAESRLISDEDTRLLYALLDEIDSDKRAVFVLAELEEMSGPEIAEALDLQLSNVYARMRLARQAFAAALHRYRLRTAGR